MLQQLRMVKNEWSLKAIREVILTTSVIPALKTLIKIFWELTRLNGTEETVLQKKFHIFSINFKQHLYFVSLSETEYIEVI